MSTLLGLLDAGGGSGALKPKFQIFAASGTFTPSAGLLAQGGVCLVHLVGGGGNGGNGGEVCGGGGGGSGEYKRTYLTLSAAQTVTIGAAGSSSTFGGLITAITGQTGNNGFSINQEGTGGAGGVAGSNATIRGGAGGSSFIGRGGTAGSNSAGGAGGAGAGGGGGSGNNYAGGAGGAGYCLVEWWE